MMRAWASCGLARLITCTSTSRQTRDWRLRTHAGVAKSTTSGARRFYRLQHPTADRRNPYLDLAADALGAAEVARAQRPALVEIAVPRHELPHEALEAIVRAEAFPPEFQHLFNGDTVALTPAFASNWIVGMQLVDPCTCWRDGKPCSACRDFTERPGGWNGTF